MLGYIYRLLAKPERVDAKWMTDCMAKHRKSIGHEFIIPNMYIHRRYEIDVMSVKKKYLYDDEIKVSRADFQRDLQKGKHVLIERGKYPANFFSYVCPWGVIMPSEVPKYAGLYWVSSFGSVRMQKAPKRINKEPQRDAHLYRITKKLDRLRQK